MINNGGSLPRGAAPPSSRTPGLAVSSPAVEAHQRCPDPLPLVPRLRRRGQAWPGDRPVPSLEAQGSPASGAAPGPSATSASGIRRSPVFGCPRPRPHAVAPATASQRQAPPAAAAVGALGPPQVREAGFAIGGRVRCGDGRPLTDRGRRRRQPRRLFADLTVPVGFVRRALHRPYTSTNRMHWCPSFTNSLSLATPRTHRSAHSRRTLRASSSRSASTLAKTSDGRFDHRSSRRSSSGLRPLCFLALQAFRRRGSIGFYETEFQCFPSSPPPTEPT